FKFKYMTAIEFSDQLLGLEQSLLKYAYRLSLNSADAKDLVQETYLKVLLSRDKFVDTGYLKAWIFTIMRNTFINNYRHNVLHNTHCDRTDESLFINQTIASDSDNPDSAYSLKEISRSIEQMNVKFRVPFKMYIEGYKYKEIADSVKLKIGTVKSRIFLARKLLMNQIHR
ncbi:MAG TPA: sigma-70 family RNA polymerase sigma factor, partial [Bacteroidales bacterium]